MKDKKILNIAKKLFIDKNEEWENNLAKLVNCLYDLVSGELATTKPEDKEYDKLVLMKQDFKKLLEHLGEDDEDR